MYKGMLQRVDLLQLCTFILSGSVRNPVKHPSSLEEADAITKNALKKLSQGKITYEQAQDDLNEALSIYEEIHTIRGMQLGARMISQLLK